MVKSLGHAVGRVFYWLMWPAWYVYFRVTPRRSRILITSGSEVLLVRGWLGTGEYELPGGGGRYGESPAKAALRELREELGLILRESDLTPLCEGEYRRHGIRIRYVTFKASLHGKRRLRPRRFEIADACWVPRRDVNAMGVRPDVTASLGALVAGS